MESCMCLVILFVKDFVLGACQNHPLAILIHFIQTDVLHVHPITAEDKEAG